MNLFLFYIFISFFIELSNLKLFSNPRTFGYKGSLEAHYT